MTNKTATRKSILGLLYVQVLVGILIGILVGYAFPKFGIELKILADGFIRLIRMMVAPIIFTSVVVGIAGLGTMHRVGRIGLKALIYFEVMTTLALVIGWLVVKAFHPGAGVNADLSSLNHKDVETFVSKAHDQTISGFFLNIIPQTMIGAFAEGEIIQVLLISVLFGIALASLGQSNRPVVYLLDQIYHALMKMIAMIIKLAPIAAFGSMAFTISKLGLGSVISLGKLLASVYLTCGFFVVVCLGLLLKFNGISLWKFLRYIREEIFIVLGTASSEPVFPRMMAKMEALGCSKPVVGLVLPAGYTFNLDGSSIYLTFGALYIAQATNTHLTMWQELAVILVCLITSKGAAAVVGSAFITLAATLSALGTIPVEGMLLIIGVDQLMASARATTNLIGNGTATVVIAKWEKEFDEKKAAEVLDNKRPSRASAEAENLQPLAVPTAENRAE
ncbi:C4-dicarboxylate transporter DctA [Pedosphaera parvula]|uniref:Sodium:dicarboxylate symporter n=1 Tax=Pedosphaera parvula (strain Ellin514) TaxID=320771 RepID=B9XC79_PEDPL|nr:C4-dicarboxylate transporter DctA [Pedosphaera parvula]EEF62547.1 sodium:dicarboxylate symporter [Pedosphaera parvula Ellin514]